MMKIFFTFLLVTLTKLSWAGPWISSGGDLIKDSKNPWFIFNTPQIRYCISIDSIHSSVTMDAARLAVKKSLIFWQREFAENRSTNVANSTTLPLTIPQFEEANCDGSEDLAILIGENTLTAQQKVFLQKTHADSIAAAIRTAYDPVNLKGKGFIYIEGDKNKKSWVSNAWSEASRLNHVMAHELGHVFGVPHIEGDYLTVTNQVYTPLNMNLMSENLPQAAVLESTSLGFQMAGGIAPILSSMKNFNSCNLTDEALKWLAINSEIKCLKLLLSDIHLPGVKFFTIYGINKKGKTMLIGSIEKNDLSNALIHSKFDIITRVYLTKEQKVFQNIEENDLRNTADGGTQAYATLNLVFRPVTNIKLSKPVIINMEPTQLSIIGISGEKFIKVFTDNRTRPLL